MQQIESAQIQQVLAQLKTLSAYAAAREIAWNRLHALFSEIAEHRAARAECKIEAQIAVLQKMLVKRFDPLPEDCSARLVSATSEPLERWSDAAPDGPVTLAAVFTEHLTRDTGKQQRRAEMLY